MADALCSDQLRRRIGDSASELTKKCGYVFCAICLNGVLTKILAYATTNDAWAPNLIVAVVLMGLTQLVAQSLLKVQHAIEKTLPFIWFAVMVVNNPDSSRTWRLCT